MDAKVRLKEKAESMGWRLYGNTNDEWIGYFSYKTRPYGDDISLYMNHFTVWNTELEITNELLELIQEIQKIYRNGKDN